ncbi:hypothetical protein SY83_18485 [Paenibacillus swuensis]|uniref:DUF2487 domain-containing protein n=1 Tax=Paenibacillus swuensis TaxID=1178515 RepID=A0A172TME8_9BACL|nr:DUF2487 family protein [Paenibacillus swuensis]ANE47953.1 hypothetical protein SY83_18485 [Paenibacillus swuensis]
MKFSEIRESEWTSLQPFLDTCLLPVTGLRGDEQPWEASRALEQLRDVLELVEIPYKGRTVTYPALHYQGDHPSYAEYINRICNKLRSSGFTYIVMVSSIALENENAYEADLIVHPLLFDSFKDMTHKAVINEQIQELWRVQRVDPDTIKASGTHVSGNVTNS